MIDFDNPPTRVADYRGTIEVYPNEGGTVDPYDESVTWETEWRWRCKSRNGQILASGEGYRRRAGALNAIDAQYAAKFGAGFSEWFDIAIEETPSSFETVTVPWRVVIHDRDGHIEKTGALY